MLSFTNSNLVLNREKVCDLPFWFWTVVKCSVSLSCCQSHLLGNYQHCFICVCVVKFLILILICIYFRRLPSIQCRKLDACRVFCMQNIDSKNTPAKNVILSVTFRSSLMLNPFFLAHAFVLLPDSQQIISNIFQFPYSSENLLDSFVCAIYMFHLSDSGIFNLFLYKFSKVILLSKENMSQRRGKY